MEENQLRAFATKIFSIMGCSESDAVLAADVLIAADLRGIESHGVARLSGYVRLWEAGRINTKPNYQVIQKKPAVCNINADAALGLVVAPFAMRKAIALANIYGVGMVTVHNSNHFGIAGYHALLAAEMGFIGASATNASPLVVPTFGAERMLGTNPICYAFPGHSFPPVVIDMATSAAANGKLEIAERENKPLPSGWAVDKEGHPTTAANALKMGGALLPLGSQPEQGSHKGYGLAALVDLLSAVLSGASFGPWVPPFPAFLPVLPNQPGNGLGHWFCAIDVEAFRERADYNAAIDTWVSRFKATKRIEQSQVVYVHGEPEAAQLEKRLKKGIPINAEVMKDLVSLGLKFKVKI